MRKAKVKALHVSGPNNIIYNSGNTVAEDNFPDAGRFDALIAGGFLEEIFEEEKPATEEKPAAKENAGTESSESKGRDAGATSGTENTEQNSGETAGTGDENAGAENTDGEKAGGKVKSSKK